MKCSIIETIDAPIAANATQKGESGKRGCRLVLHEG
jgi:hypothetical protein